MTRRARVTIEGTDALTIKEARCLIQAAMNGRFSLTPAEISAAEAACAKVAEGLIAAGQDRALVARLLLEAT